MPWKGRRGLTLIECLVALVASSVILGGMLGLFQVADAAARSNAGDIFSNASDFNLDAVLSQIAASTSTIGNNPTRVVISNTDGGTGNCQDNATVTVGGTAGPSPCQILVYERCRDLRSTAYWNGTQQNNPPNGNVLPAAIPSYTAHPFPLYENPNSNPLGSAAGMTNINVNTVDGVSTYSDNWLTGIVALYRRDLDTTDPNNGRFRTGILWNAEIPMSKMTAYGYPNPYSLCPKLGGGCGTCPASLDAAGVNSLLTAAGGNPHLIFAGTKILGIGIQSFQVISGTTTGGAMSWTVTR